MRGWVLATCSLQLTERHAVDDKKPHFDDKQAHPGVEEERHTIDTVEPRELNVSTAVLALSSLFVRRSADKSLITNVN